MSLFQCVVGSWDLLKSWCQFCILSLLLFVGLVFNLARTSNALLSFFLIKKKRERENEWWNLSTLSYNQNWNMARMAWEKPHHGETSTLTEHSHVLRRKMLLWEGDALQQVTKLFKIRSLFRSSETPCIAGNLFILLCPREILPEDLGKKYSEEGQSEKVSQHLRARLGHGRGDMCVKNCINRGNWSPC